MTRGTTEPLNRDDVRWLPLGTVVEVWWAGGNGYCFYTVTGHDLDGVPRLATRREVDHNLPGEHWLDVGLGPRPLTEVRVISAPVSKGEATTGDAGDAGGG